MSLLKRKIKYHFFSFLKHDLKASITVFFVALPLCLGIALASNAPVISGIIAGIVGGMITTLLSKSALSVSGPAAGLTAICGAAISQSGHIEIFFVSVALAGILQIALGIFKLGGFTHFIPSSVIKGMLAAIGIILISKQIPNLIGYNKPDFWSKELINILNVSHIFSNVKSLYASTSEGAILISSFSLIFLYVWQRYFAKNFPFVPASFLVVSLGVGFAYFFNKYTPMLALNATQYVKLPSGFFSQLNFPDFNSVFTDPNIVRNAILICFVASLETLLSITAIDKIDPMNRISPQNRELIAQGTGNFVSGLLGGLPITSVIVRSSANAEAGGKSRLSAFTHGFWLLLAVVLMVPVINLIPYCVLSAILIRTGFNLVKPKMIKAIYRQGREQFLPFLVTVFSILLTDLLIGVLIGIVYAIYFLIKHTYSAGYNLTEQIHGHTNIVKINLALNVSFLSKKPFINMLDKIPAYSSVEINAKNSIYIDKDILEIIHDFKAKAHFKHIELTLIAIPDIETIELHA